MSSQHQMQETQEAVRRSVAEESAQTTAEQHPSAIMQRITKGASVSPSDVIQLQQQLGNRTVSRLLSDRAKQGGIQRKVAETTVQREAGPEDEEMQRIPADNQVQRESESGEDEEEQGVKRIFAGAQVQRQAAPEEDEMQRMMEVQREGEEDEDEGQE